jgi:eukaryotic-like serine/threonine-protein kinase
MPTAAEQLQGLTLPNGWVVGRQMPRSEVQTGGCFSCAYEVADGRGRVAFLKAMDYERAQESDDPAAEMNRLTSAYLFEREVCRECGDRRMSRVVRAIESGKHVIPGVGLVEFLIFEIANGGDIRAYLDRSGPFDLISLLRCLHNIFLGMQQLNLARIAHQDLKPSNILVFEQELQKIGDLGRAWHGLRDSPHDSLIRPGDGAYAPPELLYGYTSPDDRERRFGADFYMLGSMVFFMFTGLRANALMFLALDNAHHPLVWQGTYHEVLPYLSHAFSQLIQEFIASFSDPRLGAEVGDILFQMCHPDISVRGDKLHSELHGSKFNLQRLISQLNRLEMQARLGKVQYP